MRGRGAPRRWRRRRRHILAQISARVVFMCNTYKWINAGIKEKKKEKYIYNADSVCVLVEKKKRVRGVRIHSLPLLCIAWKYSCEARHFVSFLVLSHTQSYNRFEWMKETEWKCLRCLAVAVTVSQPACLYASACVCVFFFLSDNGLSVAFLQALVAQASIGRFCCSFLAQTFAFHTDTHRLQPGQSTMEWKRDATHPNSIFHAFIFLLSYHFFFFFFFCVMKIS